jgi:large subunit ribosomal protein L19
MLLSTLLSNSAVKKLKILNLMSVLQNSSLDLDIFYKKTDLPKISLGDKVKVTIYLELPKEVAEGEKKEKERIQVFEGIVISKHLASTKIDSTVTVRKMFQGGGTEKVFVLNSPWVKSIEVLSSSIVRRSKLYYLRERTGKSARLKRRI